MSHSTHNYTCRHVVRWIRIKAIHTYNKDIINPEYDPTPQFMWPLITDKTCWHESIKRNAYGPVITVHILGSTGLLNSTAPTTHRPEIFHHKNGESFDHAHCIGLPPQSTKWQCYWLTLRDSRYSHQFCPNLSMYVCPQNFRCCKPPDEWRSVSKIVYGQTAGVRNKFPSALHGCEQYVSPMITYPPLWIHGTDISVSDLAVSAKQATDSFGLLDSRISKRFFQKFSRIFTENELIRLWTSRVSRTVLRQRSLVGATSQSITALQRYMLLSAD